MIDELLGESAGDRRADAAGRALSARAAGVTVTPFPSPQSVAHFGQPGIGIDNPDFFAAYILNTIFGGIGLQQPADGGGARETRAHLRHPHLPVDSDRSEALIGVVSTVNPRMAETIQVVRDEWARIARDGVTAEELAAAKTYLTGAYPLRFDGNAPIARILVGMQLDGRSPDYVKTRNAQIEAVTLDEINRVAARLYQPEALRFVVVGEPEGVASTD